MTLALTTQEAEEARTLIARLGVLLGDRKPTAVPPAVSADLKALTAADFARAADRLGCSVADIRAVYEVESAGEPFGPDGRCTVLYEGHVFSRETAHRFDETHGGVSWPKWDRARYPKGTKAQQHAANWDKIIYAAKLDRDAAYRSASYGGLQIMGFNFGACGFADVHAFVAAMNASAGAQLDAFVKLILAWKLDDELREHRWGAFAERYNGPSYAANSYDVKLAAAQQKWSAA